VSIMAQIVERRRSAHAEHAEKSPAACSRGNGRSVCGMSVPSPARAIPLRCWASPTILLRRLPEQVPREPARFLGAGSKAAGS